MSETKQQIFDNAKVTSLVIEYQKSNDPKIFAEILNETQSLITVISNKYANQYNLQEDLMQEARTHLIKALPEYDHKRNKKLYSYLSVVIRNTIIDYLRKQKPASELVEIEDNSPALSEGEFVAIIAEDMRVWFERRFPTLVKREKAGAILQMIIGGLIDDDYGKRKIIDTLIKEFEYKPQHAKLLYDAVLVKLRMMTEKPKHNRKPAENSLLPELKELVDEDYSRVNDAFQGLSLRFINKKGKAEDED